jgi:hypothetical protein
MKNISLGLTKTLNAHNRSEVTCIIKNPYNAEQFSVDRFRQPYQSLGL